MNNESTLQPVPVFLRYTQLVQNNLLATIAFKNQSRQYWVPQRNKFVYTKAEAIKIVIDDVCHGVLESDVERKRKSGSKFTFRALKEGQVEEFKHGWIFQCPSGGFEANGKPIKYIGGALSVAFNRKTGKYQEFYPHSLKKNFYVENFKRTGDIHEGCDDNSLCISIFLSRDHEPEKLNLVTEIKAALIKVLETHTDLSTGSDYQLVESAFASSGQSHFFLKAKSESDAKMCRAEIDELHDQLIEKHDYWGAEIGACSYAEVFG